jgi:hypothetical protein
MKRLLATTAVATMAFAGAASAQSVLERVLGQIDNATNLASVNGTFANIAENIGSPTSTVIYASNTTGEVLTAAEYEALAASLTEEDFTPVAAAADTFWINPTTGEIISNAEYLDLAAADRLAFADGVDYQITADGQVATDAEVGALEYATAAALQTALNGYNAEIIQVGGVEGINGSINNTLDGINGATQEAIASIDVSAIEWNMPTFDFGDMATTALGAVNTGDITLGVNSAVDEASTATTNAISAVVNQLGGSADTGAIILNVASNMTGVNGSINNVMEQVNGSIGNLSTTALGAVNTGTIVSGVDAAVAGIVGSTSGGAAAN